MKLNAKGAIDMLVLAALLVVVAAVGFILYSILSESEDSEVTDQTPSVSSDVFELSDFGMQFTVPEGWTVEEREPNPFAASDGSFRVSQESNPDIYTYFSFSYLASQVDGCQSVGLPFDEDTEASRVFFSETTPEGYVAIGAKGGRFSSGTVYLVNDDEQVWYPAERGVYEDPVRATALMPGDEYFLCWGDSPGYSLTVQMRPEQEGAEIPARLTAAVVSNESDLDELFEQESQDLLTAIEILTSLRPIE